jgi:hypothetical protein
VQLQRIQRSAGNEGHSQEHSLGSHQEQYCADKNVSLAAQQLPQIAV